MTDAPAIEIKSLTKTYAKSKKAPAKTALKGVDLTIPRGSIFGLLMAQVNQPSLIYSQG